MKPQQDLLHFIADQILLWQRVWRKPIQALEYGPSLMFMTLTLFVKTSNEINV